jgi:Adenylosuccinate synthase
VVGLMVCLVKQTIKTSGINGIALTKLDVLDDFDEIKVCTAYELNGEKIDYLPASSEQQFKVKPIYKSFEGWKSSTCGIEKFSKLPVKAQNYINFIEKFVDAKISTISTSPERKDTILIEDPFNT